MTKKLQYTLVLGIICALSAVGVATIYILTKDRIHQQQEKVKSDALPVVLPAAMSFARVAVKCPEHNVWVRISPGDRIKGSVQCPTGGETLDLDQLPENAEVIYAGYPAAEGKGEPVGYACTGEAQGYSSRLQLMVGVSADLARVTGIMVVFQQETPGMGNRIEELASQETLWDKIKGKELPASLARARPWFQQQFTGKPIIEIGLKQTGDGQIDGITGATITSQAVADAVKDAVDKVSKALKP